MAIVSLPYTFSAGATIIASQHNSNFSTIYNDYNGNITNVNISSSAGVIYSKLNLTNGIVNSDINSSAAIADSKLAEITTAGKVSGSALTTLPNIPSGAGIVPIANLATGTPTGSKFVRDDNTLQPFIQIGLGSWTSATQSASTQATTDGFLVGFATTNNAITTLTIKTDSSNPPTTLRAEAIASIGGSGTSIVSIFCPVKKNDYYLTTQTGIGGSATLYFISLGS